MLNDLLAIIDTIKDLVAQKKVTREDTFNTLIDPLFVELAPVVDDYFSLFRQARDLIEDLTAKDDFASPLSEARTLLRSRREEFLSARVKVRSQAEAIGAHTNDEDLVDFVNAVAALFNSSEVIENRSDGARLIEVLDECDKDADFPFMNAKIWIKRVLYNLETKWADIVRSYAQLRIKYLMPDLVLPSTKRHW